MRTYPSISQIDCEAMILHVGNCLAILDGKPGTPTLAELRMKTMLTNLLLELQLHAGDLAAQRFAPRP